MLDRRSAIEAVLARAAAGDDEAIETLMAQHRPDIQRFALKLCAGPEDAEDAVQHALYVLTTRLGSFQKLCRLTSWLFAIVKNECLRRRRSRRKTVAVEEHMLLTGDSPDVRLMRAQTVSAVSAGLARLDVELRTVLILREMGGMSAPEAASALGLSVPAVKSRLHRARAALRIELTPLARQWDLL